MCFPDTLFVFINAISTISGCTVMPHFYPTKNDNSIHFRVIRRAALFKKNVNCTEFSVLQNIEHIQKKKLPKD